MTYYFFHHYYTFSFFPLFYISFYSVAAMVAIFDSSIVPLILSLPIPKKRKIRDNHFAIDTNLIDGEFDMRTI